MRRYPAYRESGVEWLGEVPEGWEVCSLKRVTLSKCDGPFGSGLKSEHYTEDGVRVIRLQNIRSGKFNDEDRAFIDADYAASELQRHEVKGRDLLIAGLGDDNNTVGRCCVAPDQIGEAIVKADCFRFRISEEHALPAFLAYLLNVSATYDAGSLSSGTTRSRIPLSEMAARQIVTPPLPEQCTIAAFLDRETAKIDALVAEQRRLIALLAEKRQAVISHAVTRGLNPDARLKPSGIDWLGDVPEGWDVVPIRKVARLESGHTPSRSRPDWWIDCDIPWFSLADIWQIRSGRIERVSETAEMVSQLGLDNSSARLLPAGTVMLSRTASVGFSAIMGVPMATTQDFANWVCGPKLVSDFLLYCLRGMPSEFARLKMGSTHNTIYMPDIQRLTIALPPRRDQEAIVDHIRSQVSVMDDLFDTATAAIALLQERRAALISAAVTGKIDVRDLVPSDIPQETEPA